MSADYFSHPSAVIDEGAQIGSGTRIWHFCHLSARSVLGKNCILGQNVFIDNDVEIGAGVKIQNNVSVYKGVSLADDVFIGPSVVFTNVLNPRSFIERKTEFKATLVCKGATVGANATILCGVEVGEYALIAAGSVVTQNVAPFSMVAGVPARHKGWVSKQGHTLHFNEWGKASCPGNGESYTLINNRVTSDSI